MSTGVHPFLRILTDVSRSGKPVAEVSHSGQNVPFDLDFTGVLKWVRQEASFLLEGDINNPRFSLNEALATGMAAARAESLGVSI